MTLELRGIIPPLVTPFDDDENVDQDALRKEVRHHLDLGVHGICVTGSTGEGATLSLEDSCAVAAAAREEITGQVPLIAGIIRDSLKEVVRYGRALRAIGVDALQVTPVHYLFQPGPEATIDFYRRVAYEVELPVVIYNVIPWATIDAETVATILEDVPGVIAVKQSGGDMHALARLLCLKPRHASVLTAVDDLLYPAFMLGAAGAISAVLTTAPQVALRLWRAVADGDQETALECHRLLLGIWHAIDGPNMPARIKVALRLQGRNGGISRAPIDAVSAEQTERLRRALADAQLLA